MPSAGPLIPASTVESPIRLRSVTPKSGYNYLVSEPRAAGADTPGSRPLILFLHGAAERGIQVDDVTRQGLPKLLSGHPELTAAEAALGRSIAERFIIVAPQCAPFEVWEEHALLALLDEAGQSL